MNPRSFAIVSTVGLAVLLISGCGSSSSPSKATYPVTHTGSVQRVQKGTVVSTRKVKIDGKATNLGRIVGGGVGVAVGAISTPVRSTTTISQPDPGTVVARTSSNANEHRAATAVGGAVGVLVGQKVEKVLTAKNAEELTIAMDEGETVVIIQESREPGFYENERVKVVTTRTGESVVYHTDEDPYSDPDTSAYIVDDDSVDEEIEFEPVTW